MQVGTSGAAAGAVGREYVYVNPGRADRSEGIFEVLESFLNMLGRRERTKEEKEM